MDFVKNKLKVSFNNKKTIDNIGKGVLIGSFIGAGIGILNSIFSEPVIQNKNIYNRVVKNRYYDQEYIKEDDEMVEILNTILFYIKKEDMMKKIDETVILSNYLLYCYSNIKVIKSMNNKVELILREKKVYDTLCNNLSIIYESIETTLDNLSIYLDGIKRNIFTKDKNPEIIEFVKECYIYDLHNVPKRDILDALFMWQKWIDNKHNCFFQISRK